MPLIFEKYDPAHDLKIAVWENTEQEEKLLSHLRPNKDQKDYLDTMKDFRRQEWLCSRVLLNSLLDTKKYRLYKDNFGKPFLENSPYFISLSHSRNRAAAIIGKTLVGIDIQHEEEKISRIYSKFISNDELAQLDKNNSTTAYHIFWGAKESMYKAYGKKSLDFRKHMHLYGFRCYTDKLQLKGFVKKNDVFQEYNIFTDKIDNYYLNYAALSHD